MKFKILLVAMFYCGTALAQSKAGDCILKLQQTDDLKSQDLLGRVKEMAQKYWKAEEKFGEPVVTELISVFLKQFNNAGKYTKYNFGDTHHTYEYDNKGRLLVERTTGGGELIREVFEYQSDGFLKSKTIYYGTVIKYKTIYSYNGCTRIEKYYEEDGKLHSTNSTEVKFKSSPVYPGYIITNKRYDKDGYLYSVITEFNGNNDVVKHSDGGWNKSESIYEYDANGKRVKWLHDYEDVISEEKQHTVSEYNDKGDITSTKGATSNPDEKYEYTYDKKGNWTKKVTYEGDDVAYITERVITYY